MVTDITTNFKDTQQRASSKALPADNLSTWLSTRHAVKLESKPKPKSLTQLDFDMWLSSKRPKLSSNQSMVQSVLDCCYDHEPLEFWLGQSSQTKRKIAKANTKHNDDLKNWLCPEKREELEMEDLESGINGMSIWLHGDRVPGYQFISKPKKTEKSITDDETELSGWLQIPSQKEDAKPADNNDWKQWLQDVNVGITKDQSTPFGFEIVNTPLSHWKPVEPVNTVDEELQKMNLKGSGESVNAWLDQNESYLSSSSSSSSNSSDEGDRGSIRQWLCIPAQDEVEDESSIVVIDEADSSNTEGSFVFSPSFC